MNAIQKALSELTFRIPPEILDLAFRESYSGSDYVIHNEERIMASVIRKRVLVDANLVGGIMTNIDVSECFISYLNSREYLVTVPNDLTNGATIMSVLSLTANSIFPSQVMMGNSTPDVLNSATSMMTNLGTANIVQTSRIEVISDNVIMIQDPSINLLDTNMRCVVANSPNLENINPRSYLKFAKLVELAVMSYIYNQLIVKLDKAYIYNGHELGIVKDIIEKYSDKEEEYQIFLETKWKKIAFMNDSDRMSRYTQMMLGNAL